MHFDAFARIALRRRPLPGLDALLLLRR